MKDAVSIDRPRSPIAATNAMKIRDAAPTDLPAIVAIYNAAVATRISTAQLDQVTVESRRDWLKDHNRDRHPFWVAELEGKVAGWLTIKPFIPRAAYQSTAELSVYVDQNLRRRGIGRALLEEAIARGPALQIRAMVGLIFTHNKPSLKLFQQLGFERWGFLPGVAVLDGVSRDLAIMGRHV